MKVKIQLPELYLLFWIELLILILSFIEEKKSKRGNGILIALPILFGFKKQLSLKGYN